MFQQWFKSSSCFPFCFPLTFCRSRAQNGTWNLRVRNKWGLYVYCIVLYCIVLYCIVVFHIISSYGILYKYMCIYIYIWSHPLGPIRALGAGVIILDNYIMNMITCSKTLQITVKNASWMKMTLSILTFQMDKNPISWNQNLALTLQKAAWEWQKCK